MSRATASSPVREPRHFDAQSSQDVPMSSPIGMGAAQGRRQRRPPTITPKRFTRFFTPRQQLDRLQRVKEASKTSRRLRDITHNAVNQKARILDDALLSSQASENTENTENLTPQRSIKRRRVSDEANSSPLQPSPTRSKYISARQIPLPQTHDDFEDDLEDCLADEPFPEPVIRTSSLQASTRILERSFGGLRANGRGRLRDHGITNHVYETADFHSTLQDSHVFSGIPFCSTSCNTNSLVLVGTQEGSVKLFDSSSADGVDFRKVHVTLKPHQNAIMDATFSSDDYLLATASGDQSTRITDMHTQQTKFLLPGHTSSVKQVRFQPGNDNILATSSRDGSVQLWDTRCRGNMTPNLGFRGVDPEPIRLRQVVYADKCISIRNAHALPDLAQPTGGNLFKAPRSNMKDLNSKRADISITAIDFLPQGREHFLLTASEANASVKLWDIRARHYPRRGNAAPVSATVEPKKHIEKRPYGLSSLALSTDGARIYSLCKDNSVYTYSTNDLIHGKGDTEALYAFRHPRLVVDTFYVKMHVRRPRNDKTELLAVGSALECPVLFSTDESDLYSGQASQSTGIGDNMSKTVVSKHAGIRSINNGTALIEGHRGEVSSLNWTVEGDLVTVGDDRRVRCWREAPKAAELRCRTDRSGRRWNSGWADVGSDYDIEC